MLSDIEIAYRTEMKPIMEIAESLGLYEDEIELHGKYIAKISLSVLERLADRPNGKLITVTAITPTPLGEGKTVTAIGLGQALHRLGQKVCNTMRESSKGPTFGIKGGATGGGYAQVLPMVEINLNFTGDIHAVESAHNLCAAAIDAHILHGNKLNIDPLQVTWTRCVDVNDRALRDVVIGLGGRANGYPRQTSYDITVATETAAIHALAMSLKDLRKRLGRIVVGFTYDGRPVTAEDLKVAGAMTALMKDSIKPNLCQSLEHHPVFVHGFPFANVAFGNNSVLADMIALKLADYVVTESGFGADCGFEKLIDVKCRQSGLKVDCAVIVASIRALKLHGGAFQFRPGQSYESIKDKVEAENPEAVEKGCENLAWNIGIAKKLGVPVVVAVNRFTKDSDREIEIVMKKAIEAGADGVAVSECWARGGEGGIDLAKEVMRVIKEKPAAMRYLYPDELSIQEKVEILAKEIYNASGVEFTSEAQKKLELYTKLGYDRFPINMAKTHLSISHDPNWKGVPKDYIFPVRDIRASVGAGFLYPIAGEMRTMPGLPSRPAFVDVDIDEQGRVIGLF
jgi:formate--tetrahydrofolate ligase